MALHRFYLLEVSIYKYDRLSASILCDRVVLAVLANPNVIVIAARTTWTLQVGPVQHRTQGAC
jgi:hypothetical protein